MKENLRKKLTFFVKFVKKKSVNVSKHDNLKKHLETNEISKKWLKYFTQYRDNPKITSKINIKILNIINLFLN